MKNFTSIEYTFVNGVATIKSAQGIMPRSLVILNARGKGFNVLAKCRNTDKVSVLKALTKAVFSEMRVCAETNALQCVQKSGNTQSSLSTAVLNCAYVCVTDKNGRCISSSMLSTHGVTIHEKLKDVISTAKKVELHKLIVVEGRAWDDEVVVAALNEFVKSAVAKLDYCKKLDDALEDAANSTYAESAAEIRAKWEATHPATATAAAVA